MSLDCRLDLNFRYEICKGIPTKLGDEKDAEVVMLASILYF